MGRLSELIAPARRRRCKAWYWRARYWWMDTDEGKRAHVVTFCLLVLVVLIQFIRMGIEALLPRPADEPSKAIYWWVVQIIIAVVAAVVAYAMRPKFETPKAKEIEAPSVQDGTAAKDYLGTFYIEHDDNFLLDWKVVGRDPIRTKGGKK